MRVSLSLQRVISERVERNAAMARTRALTFTAMEALRDITPYVPALSGDLMASTGGSRFEEGMLVWQTEYAAYQYHDYPNKTTLIHPLASMEWAEVAKQRHGKEWRDKLARDYFRVLKGGR